MKLLVKVKTKTVARLWFPNSLLKSKFLLKCLLKKSRFCADKVKQIQEAAIESYKCLKAYVKKFGHFNLIEVDSADQAYVLIRI